MSRPLFSLLFALALFTCNTLSSPLPAPADLESTFGGQNADVGNTQTRELTFALKHSQSGKCIHPEFGSVNGNAFEEATNLILFTGCNESRLQFRMLQNGALQHVLSGKCVHPSGGSRTPGDNTNLIFYAGCDKDYIQFRLTKDGSLVQATSGLCWRPRELNNPTDGTQVVIHSGCNSPEIKFKPDFSFALPQNL